MPEKNELAVIEPFSLYSIVPPKLKAAIDKIPDELLNLEEDEFILRAYGDENSIPVNDYGLRKNFWKAYDSSQTHKKPITNQQIYEGVCSERNFYTILENPIRVAFIITQPKKENTTAGYILALGWNELAKIMKMPVPINTKTGVPDTKILDLKMKAFQYLDARQNGAIIQRVQQTVEQRSVNVNIDGNQQADKKPMSPEEYDAAIAQLEERAGRLSAPKEVVELLPVEAVELEVRGTR